MEVVPGIHQLKVPIPDNPLGFLNSYLIRGDGHYVLVDTGWNAKDSFASLEQQLNEIGVRFTDISQVVITHIHPDHFGLAGKIKEVSGAEVVVHEVEKSFIELRYQNWKVLLQEMATWMHVNGVPGADLVKLRNASEEIMDVEYLSDPDRTVSGGETIEVGSMRFEIMWTPGHSPGHICLYEAQRRVLLSGDHVLPVITPNVSLHSQSFGNPLADYVDALRAVGRLPVDIVLPAHEDIFYDLPKRVQEILAHHEARERAILDAIGETPRTAYEIACIIPWELMGRTWEEIPAWEKRSATTETLAHLEHMHTKDLVEKTNLHGLVYYGKRAGLSPIPPE
ncbi:MAG: MBL fold metallo-hydrolase [Chloroflexota bacterium]|nr:MAG: MBL fold metallo-hydrolase [Chloroflexota bacterium]